jgi:hypothetical protein
MVREIKSRQPKDAEKLAPYLLECYEVTAVCPKCHHERTMGNLFLRRWVGGQKTIGELRARLRCHKCGQRGCTVRVIRLPR